ncbi:thioredoxin-disulfide reductase [Candidatus Bathyarchaeota archaeon]|nr:thioredoxin-disulfide reductase [Candidatus Bathyarchaeota archaeon]
MENYDVIIIGAGPAGLAAGIYAVRSGLKTLVLEEKMAGGTVADAPVVDNYPGLQGATGNEISQKMSAHAKSAGVKINEFEGAESLKLSADAKVVKTKKTEYETKAIIIASGSHYRELGIPGEKEFRGRGVSYCGICDGPFFKGKRVIVVGGGNSALITALYLAHIAGETKVVHRRDTFRAEEVLVSELKSLKNTEILWNTEAKEIRGDKIVRKVVDLDQKNNETKELPVDGVFVQVGESPNSQTAKEAGIAVDDDGFIIIDAFQHTNIAGVYAAGDVTNHPVKQVGTAVGQGITAALEAYWFIRRPYYKQ